MKCDHCGKNPQNGLKCKHCGAQPEWAGPLKPPVYTKEEERLILLVKLTMENYMPTLEDRLIERLRGYK